MINISQKIGTRPRKIDKTRTVNRYTDEIK